MRLTATLLGILTGVPACRRSSSTSGVDGGLSTAPSASARWTTAGSRAHLPNGYLRPLGVVMDLRKIDFSATGEDWPPGEDLRPLLSRPSLVADLLAGRSVPK